MAAEIRHQHPEAKPGKKLGIVRELPPGRSEAMAKHPHRPIGWTEGALNDADAGGGDEGALRHSAAAVSARMFTQPVLQAPM